MSCGKQVERSRCENKGQPQPKQPQVRNDTLFRELLGWFVPQGDLFAKEEFHGNVRWGCETHFARWAVFGKTRWWKSTVGSVVSSKGVQGWRRI